MMKKLSLKEKWLNEQAALAPKPVLMEVDSKSPSDCKKSDEKNEKKSFFNGILSSVKHLIKNDKDKEKRDKKKSTSPPSGESVDLDKLIANEKVDVDDFDELVIESDQPVPGCVNKRIQAFMKKQKSEEVREEADDILNNIKDGKDRMAKQMRDMEQRRFSDNMNAIKSSVVDSKVASMKEVKNLSKYFPSQQDKKPPAIAKNRDIKALKDVNLSKYFPQESPTSGAKASGSPSGQSTTSSAAASPLMPRKNINDIDLMNYFPGTPVLNRKTFSSTQSSPMPGNTPNLERRFSITTIANSIPPPPPPPLAKRNVLSLQTVKKKQPPNENINTTVMTKATSSDKKEALKKGNKRDDFNMFDQLLDGAIDLKQVEDKLDADLNTFDTLIKESKLERSPSKEYEKIFDAGLGKSKFGSKEISPEISNSSTTEDLLKDDKKSVRKTKKKSPKKVTPERIGLLDKLAVDPKIFQNLTNEYQRLLCELERSSKSPEVGASKKIEKSDPIAPVQLRLDNKRKSPQKFEDRKKFKEEAESIQKAENIIEISPEMNAEEDSVVARLEKKYRRASLKKIEELEVVAEKPALNADFKEIEVSSGNLKNVPSTNPDEPCSVIERLERKWKQKREIENSAQIEPENRIAESCEVPNISPKKSPTQELRRKPIKQLEVKAQSSPEPLKKKEISCFETLLSLPKESIDDIFTEFEMTDKETEKALKTCQESFEKLHNKTTESGPKKVLESIPPLPRKNAFEPNSETNDRKIDNVQIFTDNSIQQNQKRQTKHEKEKRQQKCKSLQMDLAEIDFGISERPLNLESFFPRRTSIEEIPDSPKSLNSFDGEKIISARDSAYSGSRKSSAEEKEIQDAVTRNEFKANKIAENLQTFENKTTHTTEPATHEYINVLKEISSGLFGFNDELLIPMDTQLKTEKKKAQVKTQATKVNQKADKSYARVLQDISSNLVGLDLREVESQKNYSQIIPPSVNDPQNIRKIPSANNLEVPHAERIRAFHPNEDEVSEIQIPVPPIRRHKSVESSDATELSLKVKRFMPVSKSFDYDTVSGRTSKNSTEYYDHYYPTTSNGQRRLEKYELPRKNSLGDGGLRTRTRQKAIDDLVVKSTHSRMYDTDDVPLRRQSDYRRENSEPSDANLLLEKSHMLHRRKESFMRDQMNESNNPYIREMMKQDVHNPIDISDIKFIRNHPTTPLPSLNHHLTSYQRPASYVPSVRTPVTFGKSSGLSHTQVSSSSYGRSSAVHVTPSYKTSVASSSSIRHLNPSSNTATSILTKSHTMSPHSSHTNSYSLRQRPITSLTDTSPSSRYPTHSRPASYSQNKTSASSRDACVIS